MIGVTDTKLRVILYRNFVTMASTSIAVHIPTNQTDPIGFNRSIRRICITLNNYTEEDVSKLKEFIQKRAKYGIFGKEEGELGTPHLQGYM